MVPYFEGTDSITGTYEKQLRKPQAHKVGIINHAKNKEKTIFPLWRVLVGKASLCQELGQDGNARQSKI